MEKESKFQKLKRMWKDPKGHVFIELGLWGIFFGFMIIFLFINNALSGSKVNINKDPYSYDKSDNYEYKITINNNLNNEILIEGIRYKEKEVFSINSIDEYYIENDKIISKTNKDINKLLIFDILKIRPKNLANYLNSNTDYKKTKYNNGNSKIEFTLNAKDFNILNKPININNSNIKMSFIEENDKVIEVNIDITNLAKQINNKFTSYKIKTEYSNIDNISDFTLKDSQ